MALEGDGDREARPGVRERLDRDVDGGADGPSTPRTPHLLGGSTWTTSAVTGRLANPMRRVVRHRSPTFGASGVSGVSIVPSTTPFCHSENRDGSVA